MIGVGFRASSQQSGCLQVQRDYAGQDGPVPGRTSVASLFRPRHTRRWLKTHESTAMEPSYHLTDELVSRTPKLEDPSPPTLSMTGYRAPVRPLLIAMR